MGTEKTGFLSYMRQHADIIIKAIGTILIPILIGYLSYTIASAQRDLSRNQAELQRQQAEGNIKLQQKQVETNIDFKLVDLFLKEYHSGNPIRKRFALNIVEMHKNRPILIDMLAPYNPEAALQIADKTSYDETLSTRTRVQAGDIRNRITNRFMILQPADADAVKMLIDLKGETPFLKMKHHYIVVTPLKTGTDIVESEANVADGSFSGRAKLGAAGIGNGEKFFIRVVATNTLLKPGTALPTLDNSISSNSISVTRQE